MSSRWIVLPLFIVMVAALDSRVYTQTPKKAHAQTRTTTPPKSQPIPAAASSPTTGWDERVLKVPVVGQAWVYVPKQPVQSVVLFISGDGGWELGVVDMARRIMPKAIVIGISYVALRKAPAATVKCWMPSGDLEVIAQSAERQLKLPAYRQPILVGYSSGATLVYEALAASPLSFAGGLSMGFCPDLPANHSVCASDNFKPPPLDVKKNVVWLPKVEKLSREWYVVNGVQDEVCLPPEMHKFLDDMGNVHFLEAPGTGHGFGRPVRWGPVFDEAMTRLLESTASKPPAPKPPPSAAVLQQQLDALDLPLEYQWADKPKASVVFVSGDGGWAPIDNGVSQFLAGHGVSVVGLNSLSYFWNEKTPQQAGADVRRIFGVLSNANLPVFVGGYSIGAEVTPFVLDQWPDADRRKVYGQLLVAPSETASFQISVLDWVFRAKETPLNVADAVRRSRVPTLCLSGKDEEPRDTACDDLKGAAESIQLPGSHHFNSKYDAVGQVLLTFIERRMQ